MKFIFVLGGVISGCGKGIASASIALLLKSRGHDISIMKCDPYFNTSASTLAPAEHGECFVLDCGLEVDLDLGHYQRIASIEMSAENICTSGQIYKELIVEEEDGKYLGQTIQLIPHATKKIIRRWEELGQKHDLVVIEIGGCIGDVESFPFLEAIRQLKQKSGMDHVVVGVIAPILWVQTIEEFKTKPLQNSIKELQRHGISPDILLCRVDRKIPDKILDKISNLCGIPREAIFDAPDVPSIYQVPLEFYSRHVDDLLVDKLRLKRSGCRIHKYRETVEKYLNNDLPTITIGIFGKYGNTCEAYLSIKEALLHAGLACDVKVKIRWVNSQELESYKDMRGVYNLFDGLDGIIVPGGFDERGVEGKIKAIRYVREKDIPFLGICLGLQCAVIEFARNVCNLEGANSLEFDTDTKYPVICYVEGQEGLRKKSATMRLGACDCYLQKNSLARSLYGEKNISERHRHRYEVNNDYVDCLSDKGMRFSGMNKDSGLVEIIELPTHHYFIATQAHPEFKSRLMKPAPLFKGLIEAARKRKEMDKSSGGEAKRDNLSKRLVQ
jgi:CTP synthase